MPFTLIFDFFAAWIPKILNVLFDPRVIIAIVLLVISGYTWWHIHKLNNTIEDNTAQISLLTTKLEAEKAAKELCISTNITNKQQLDKVAVIADKLQAGFDQLGADLQKQSSASTNRIAGILTGKKPVTCNESIEFLIQKGAKP